MLSFFDRLDKFLDYKGLNDNKATIQSGIGNGILGKGRKRGTLSQENIVKLLTAFPDLDANWLLMGDGNMVNSKGQGDMMSLQKLPSAEMEKIISEQLIPVYEFQIFASLPELLSNKSKPSSYMYLPNIPKCDGATAMPGDSMEPEIRRGDLIVYRKVNNIETEPFLGQMYFLTCLLNGTVFDLVRYVVKADDSDHVRLTSPNKRYSPTDIPIDSIKSLAMIHASVRFASMI